jgi:hypothetical protein
MVKLASILHLEANSAKEAFLALVRIGRTLLKFIHRRLPRTAATLVWRGSHGRSSLAPDRTSFPA